MGRIERFCERFADALIWLFISIYVAIFTYLCILKYNSFGYLDWDFASDIVTLWNSVHGKMFYYPFLEENILGGHLYLIILFLIPIYAVFQHPVTLLFMQSLFLGLAAYPLYLLAKSQLNKTFAIAISMAYLLYPSLGYINLFETHFEIYEIFFLFFALYFFEKDDFRRFLIFILFAIICKENVSLVIFMLGIYALLRRKSKRWILIPSLLGITWFLLSIKVIIPFFAKDAELYQGGFMFNVYYSHLGETLFGMIKTIILYPIQVARYAFSPEKVLYLVRLFMPTGFLGLLLSPAPLLITIPVLMQNLLSSAETHTLIYFQYVALLIPFIFYSLIYGFKKLINHETIGRHRTALLVGFLVVAILSSIHLGGPQLYLADYLKIYRKDYISKEKEKVIRLIPQDAPCIATFQFLPKLANRRHLYSLHLVSGGFRMYTNVRYEPPPNLEYALIDFNEPLMINSFFPPDAPANIRKFLKSGNWKVLKGLGDIILFKKGYREGNELCGIVQNPNVENVVNANISNKLVFLGYNIVEEGMDKDRILHIVFYWKRIGPPCDPLRFSIWFLDPRNNAGFIENCIFGYRVYLLESFPQNQIFMEHRYIFIPPDIKRGTYSMRIGPFTVSDESILPVLGDIERDAFGGIILKDVLLAN